MLYLPAAASGEAEAVLSSVLSGEIYRINSECDISKATVMDNDRLELKGYSFRWLETLRSLGCFTEIIRYKTRVFIPNNEKAVDIISSIQDNYMSL